MKKTIFTIITFALISFSNFLNAQTPNWAWAKSAGNTSNDQGNCVATDASGNIYMTGTFMSPTITFGTTTLTSIGSVDVYIVKYDANGNVIWAKSAGGTDEDGSSSVATDTSGNVFITGTFESNTISFGTTTLINANNTGLYADVFIAKYDTTGNVIWAKSAGGAYRDVSSSVATDASGNVFITGDFQSPAITFGGTTLTNTAIPYEDIFIVKYDASGNVLWAKSTGSTIATSPSDRSSSVATDASGNVYMTGYFEGAAITFVTTTVTNTSTDFGELFIVKYDASGNVLWAKSAGSISNDLPSSVATDATGNVVVSGYFSGFSITFGTITLTNPNQSFSFTRDIFIVKYDSAGNVQWAKRAGGASDEYAQSVATDLNGNIFMTGQFFSPAITFGTETLVNAGGWMDIFIVKYDSSGNVQWAESAGGTSLEYCSSVVTDATGNAYITGSFYGASITFGTDTLINTAASYDIFIAKIGATLSVDEQTDNSGMVIAPNPFSSQTTISFKEEQVNTTIKIIDILGKEIQSIQFNGMQFILEKGKMQPGIYVVQVLDANNTLSTRKIAIQ